MILPKLNKQSTFPLGKLVATANAMASLEQHEILKALQRHQTSYWGEVCRDDGAANDQALRNGGRLLSRYTTSKGVVFWIITEADRSVTTVLLPEDY